MTEERKETYEGGLRIFDSLLTLLQQKMKY